MKWISLLINIYGKEENLFAGKFGFIVQVKRGLLIPVYPRHLALFCCGDKAIAGKWVVMDASNFVFTRPTFG